MKNTALHTYTLPLHMRTSPAGDPETKPWLGSTALRGTWATPEAQRTTSLFSKAKHAQPKSCLSPWQHAWHSKDVLDCPSPRQGDETVAKTHTASGSRAAFALDATFRTMGAKTIMKHSGAEMGPRS